MAHALDPYYTCTLSLCLHLPHLPLLSYPSPSQTFTLDQNPEGLLHMQKDLIVSTSAELGVSPQVAEVLLLHHSKCAHWE